MIFILLILSKSLFFTVFLSMNIEISKGNKTKTKSFDVIITKYTLCVLLAFTVYDFWAFSF